MKPSVHRYSLADRERWVRLLLEQMQKRPSKVAAWRSLDAESIGYEPRPALETINRWLHERHWQGLEDYHLKNLDFKGISKFHTGPGTRDILAPDSARWRAFQSEFADLVEAAGYNFIIPPIFEDLGVFLRLGESTEVVTKEMYDFEDKGGRRIALRPEQTASVCRAFVEHRPPTPWKVWYAGPNFRYERPQKGRYRQFDQVGIEVLGVDDPFLDAEVIALAMEFYKRLGLKQVKLTINSLGDVGDRENYAKVLRKFFESHADGLSEKSRATLVRNPLRVLDSKRLEDQQIIASAPLIGKHRSIEAERHFESVLNALQLHDVKFEVAERLVRGLDYYRRTTFEFISTALQSAHTAIGGGGRYNGLVEALGGPSTPGIGFALGLDRTLLACDAEGVFVAPRSDVNVFVVDTTGGMHAAKLFHELRAGGISVDRAFDNRSLKAQLKVADRSGSPIALIVGTNEVASETAVLRLMTSGKQRVVSRSTMVDEVRRELNFETASNEIIIPDQSTSLRTHLCGVLRSEHIGSKVTLCGWIARRREHGEHLAFIDLRDYSGITQCVVDNAIDVRSEWVVQITGRVQARPEGTVNGNIPTGAIELVDCEITVLNSAEPPPFSIDQRADDVDENIRLKYRYLDIRRERMQRNLRIRSKVNSAIRRAMEEQGFVEVETPFLTASTPEGAREFLVPSRKEPGSFYALPQSPQLWKQLLMVAGIDRYYQIARCLRDEDLRSDRQYEFMQLDAEMSFVSQDDVLAAISAAVLAAAEAVIGGAPTEIERITWHESMTRFGVDKPDLRFGLELIELTSVFAATEFKAFSTAPSIKGLRVDATKYPDSAALGRNKLDALTDRAKELGAKGLVWIKVDKDGSLESPVAKFLTPTEHSALIATMGAKPGDLLLLIADTWTTTCDVLGQLRNDIGRPPVHEGPYRYVWVTDFPLFVGVNSTTGKPQPGHHPFCQPHLDDIERLETDPMSVRALAYDLVLNGWELGSGSIRIHDSDLQRRVFRQLGISDEDADRKFGFFLTPFKFGAPPHGGFAFGTDRLVAILAGENNIREVIAFPKTQSGADPLTNAPTPVDQSQLNELGINVKINELGIRVVQVTAKG